MKDVCIYSKSSRLGERTLNPTESFTVKRYVGVQYRSEADCLSTVHWSNAPTQRLAYSFGNRRNVPLNHSLWASLHVRLNGIHKNPFRPILHTSWHLHLVPSTLKFLRTFAWWISRTHFIHKTSLPQYIIGRLLAKASSQASCIWRQALVLRNTCACHGLPFPESMDTHAISGVCMR